jgi:hypothetical protein
MVRRILLSVIFLSLVSGCGKTVSGTASFYKGIAGTAREASPAPPPGERSGTWYLTPDKVTMTITSIALGNEGDFEEEEDLSCEITWERGSASLAKLTDCPFTVGTGTYTGIQVKVANQIKVTISDAANGIYTNSASVSKLASTGPAEEVTVDVCISCPAGSSQTFASNFLTGITVDETTTPSVSVIFDPVQWLSTFPGTATFGDQPFTSTNTGIPLVPTLSGLSKVEFYSNAGTLSSFEQSNREPKVGVKIYYATDTAPLRADLTYGARAFSGCANNFGTSAWSASHKTATPGGSGNSSDLYFGNGGYLGLASNTLAWAFPTTFSYGQWAAVMTLPVAATVGGSASLSYSCTSNVPDPVSGDTFSSGLPSFTPTGTVGLTLVGR